MATARRPRRSASPPLPAITLSGPPSRLRATVTVENTSDQRLAIRGTTLHLDSGQTLPGTASALIGPGATAAMPVAVSLDPATAPGEYAAELEISGIRRPVAVRVTPHLALSVTPSEVLATAGRHSVGIEVVNEGNVAVPIAGRVVASTDDGRGRPGPDVSLDLRNPTTLAPGDIATLEGWLTVPTGLDPERRHVAHMPIGVADLVVIVLPHAGSETPS